MDTPVPPAPGHVPPFHSGAPADSVILSSVALFENPTCEAVTECGFVVFEMCDWILLFAGSYVPV